MKSSHPFDLLFRDEDYLDHESWVRHCFQGLGDLRGENVLDYGCGSGFSAVVLARWGAYVSVFEACSTHAFLTRTRAELNGLGDSVNVEVMKAEQLRYQDSTFDAVFGNAVLQLVDLGAARGELYRVMKPGAIAVFAEPLGENPFLELARNYLYYPGKARLPHARPLRYSDIAFVAQPFESVQVSEFQLTSMIRRVIGNSAAVKILERFDQRLLARFPSWKRFCRYVVVQLRKGK